MFVFIVHEVCGGYVEHVLQHSQVWWLTVIHDTHNTNPKLHVTYHGFEACVAKLRKATIRFIMSVFPSVSV